MTRTPLELGLGLALCITGLSHADAFEAKPLTFAATIPMLQDGDSDDEDGSGVYLRLNGGINLMSNASISDIPFQAGMSYGLRDAEISFNAGTDFGVGIGIPLNTNLSLEIMTGLNYNSIDSMSGTFYDGGGSSDFVSGSGHTWQVPAMCNLLWRFDVTDTFNIGIHGGVGFQYSYLWVHSVYGGAVGPWNYDFSGGNTSFRYQGGLDLTWDLGPCTLGGYVRYSASNEVDLEVDFQGSNSINLDSLANLAIGLTFTVTF